MKIIHTLNLHNISEKEAETFDKRESARAVVFNKDRSKIAMQYTTKHKSHKLPGGGIEKGEDMRTALERECEEDIGYDIEIENEIGAIVEYRKFKDLQIHQTSYCFTAHVINEQKPLNLDPGEIDAGFIVEWMTIVDAKNALSKEIKEKSTYRNNQFILPRDLFILNNLPQS